MQRNKLVITHQKDLSNLESHGVVADYESLLLEILGYPGT